VAVALEADRRFDDLDEGRFHITTWSAARYVGIYHKGTIAAARELADELSSAIGAAGYRAAPDALPQLFFAPDSRDEPAEDRFSLYRVAVVR
jgi:hypothetical protein